MANGIGSVWAANFGEDGKPNGVGSVWIENASAFSGGGGGNPEVESYVQTNSATITDVNTSYQTNSANFIPYTASGVELTNSNFKIDTSGQAYKLGLESGTIPLEFDVYEWGYPLGALAKLENGVTYTLTIQGAYDNTRIEFINSNTHSPYEYRPTITNNQCTFTWTYEDATVEIFDENGMITRTNTTLTYIDTTEKRYVLENELSSGYLQTSGLEYNSVNEISAINGSALAGGGSSDTFYIYPGKTTDKEISENSGKDLKLYNSANNVFLDYAGKSTLSNYTIFSFKEITGTQYNQNTLQHLRLRVYPNATSACKVYDTNTVNLLDSNSTVSQANTAYYDAGGYSLTQSRMDFEALNSFVQSNSASWGQGGGSDVQSNGIWVTRSSNTSNRIINNSNDNVEITFYTNSEYQPSPIYINGSEYYWYENYDGQFNWYCSGPSINSNSYVEGIPQDYLIRISNVNWAESKSAQISFDGVKLYGDKVIFSAEYNGDADTYYIEAYGAGNIQQISSFNLTYPGVSASFESNMTNTEWMRGRTTGNSYNIMMSFPGEGGSTVASSDVFPPTNNLDPYSTYYLGWNANNGGLFWYQTGNGGN